MKRSPPSSSLLSLPPLLSSQRGSGGRKSSAGEMNKWLKYCQLVRLFFFLLFLVFPFFVVVPLRFSTKRGERDGKEQKTPPRTKKGKVFTHTLLALDFFFKSPTKINQKKKAERGFFFFKRKKKTRRILGGRVAPILQNVTKFFPQNFTNL